MVISKMERDTFSEADEVVNLFTPLCITDADYDQEDSYYSAMDIILTRFDRFITGKASSEDAFDRFQVLLDMFYLDESGLKARIEKIVEMDAEAEQRWALAELEFMKPKTVDHVPPLKGPVFH